MVKEWKSCFLWLWLYYFSTLLRVVRHWSNVLERQGDLTPPQKKNQKKTLLIIAYKTALWCMNNYVMLFLLCQNCMQENCAWTITTFFFFLPESVVPGYWNPLFFVYITFLFWNPCVQLWFFRSSQWCVSYVKFFFWTALTVCSCCFLLLSALCGFHCVNISQSVRSVHLDAHDWLCSCYWQPALQCACDSTQPTRWLLGVCIFSGVHFFKLF